MAVLSELPLQVKGGAAVRLWSQCDFSLLSPLIDLLFSFDQIKHLSRLCKSFFSRPFDYVFSHSEV